ncbi:hypothetical protein FJT64_002351 [Amphibalanus amphitrite]|uniref:Apple domain-containing protein n=1 Tax=Amphibalanus amphitrite TaxID=1232801 RepID=A0A6A4WWS5_AMPAM|nr:hypothetical protein FJT64_002351 [Amphibalanus amphitrite]
MVLVIRPSGECLARCFRRVDCLSFSWMEGHCILYSVRGNVGSLRPGPVRFRTGLAAEVVYVQRNVSVFGAALLNCSGDESRPMALVGLKDDPATAAQTPWQPEYQCGPGQLLVAVSTSIGQYLPRPGILCAPVEEPHTIGPVGCETVTISEPEKYQSSVSDTESWPFQCPQLPQPLGITAVSIDTLQKQWTSITCCLIV